ncbi:hypothetical protein K501DRAFT_334659 [Backusella circina FSU 941]|nr:hypothetical protein K501DRAFT_334659 [Backusella circina FSU 941]
MHSRGTAVTPPQNMINPRITTTFNPIVLFNDSSPSSEDNTANKKASSSDQEKIEKHRINVKRMLDTNAKLWESSWGYEHYDSDPISSGTENTQIFPQEQHDKKIANLQNLLAPYNPNPSMDEHNEYLGESIEHNILLPQERNSVPTYLVQDPQNVQTQTTYEIDKGKNQRVDEPISNRLRFKLNLNYPQHLSQSEPNVSTSFVSETLETHSYDPSNKKRKRENIPKEMTEHLRQWLIQHKKHPYPTEIEKQELAEETGLMINQISNWFINARRRILQPMLKNENRKIKIIQDKVIYSNYPLFDQSLNSNSTSNDSSNYTYTHRRFYDTNEEDSVNPGESSSISSMIALPTFRSSANFLTEDEELFKD